MDEPCSWTIQASSSYGTADTTHGGSRFSRYFATSTQSSPISVLAVLQWSPASGPARQEVHYEFGVSLWRTRVHSAHCHLSEKRLLKCLGLPIVALSTGDILDTPVVTQSELVPVMEPLGARPAQQLPRQRQRGVRHGEQGGIMLSSHIVSACWHPRWGQKPLSSASAFSSLSASTIIRWLAFGSGIHPFQIGVIPIGTL